MQTLETTTITRTTVTLDADVLALLKKTMRERDASFKQVLNDGLRAGLDSAAAAARRPLPIDFPVHHLGRPLVDLAKAHALAGELDDLEKIARMQRRAQQRLGLEAGATPK
jgi:hypothetical protein